MFNNVAGNIFPATPPTCSSAVITPPTNGGGSGSGGGTTPPTTGTPGTGTGTAEDTGIRFVGYFNSKTTGSAPTENVSLLDFLANNTLGAADYDPDTGGTFTGRYIVIHSNDGLIYIIGLVP
jgi:hypothetical protein